MIKLPRKPRSLFGKLMLSYLGVVAISLLIIGLFLIYLIESYFLSAREWELAAQTRDVAYLVSEDLVKNDFAAVRKTAEALAYSLGARIGILDYNRVTVYTLDPEAESGSEIRAEEGIWLEAREIEHIYRGNMITKKIYGPVLQWLLVAAPVYYEGQVEDAWTSVSGNPEVVGAVTLSVPLKGIEETLAQISRLMLFSGLVGVIVAGVIAFSVSKTLTRPLQKINRAALDLAAGRFGSRIEEETDDEIGVLIKTFNYSVEQVEKNIEEQKRLELLRRNLVANVSHELKAPLASVRGFSELMLDGLIEENEKEKYLKIILDNSVHLGRLVDDLLTLSHLESGQLSLDIQELAVGDLARWSFETVLPRGESKGVNMHLDLDSDLSPLNGDRHRMHEVLVNLLENAVTFTPPGGDVKLCVATCDSRLVMEIKDTGCGIPEYELPNIFERFYKVDKARRRSDRGSGLGLAITRQLVELHGGRIEVESRIGEGSTFRVILPLA
jgi:signal transduction histidine kinase